MNWTVEESRELYNIAQWSERYFDIDEDGAVVARVGAEHRVALPALIAQLQQQGLSAPLLLRFNHILHHRIDSIWQAFSAARERFSYNGDYRVVYPIKVNQQRHVVEQLIDHGGERFGLEAGSKAELMAVLALARPNSIIVCNGYKDREYVRLALIGEKLGHRVFIVVEKSSELTLLMDEATRLDVRPRLGVRVRLASVGQGKWQNSGGEKSKFGLSASQILRLMQALRDHGRIDSLQLIHYHLGSQLANIRDIQRALRECARYYAVLREAGAPIDWVDVGGGLGVDYEGTNSRSYCSANYSVQEYANKVVGALADICAERDLPHPNIISESGRALTAHHAVLVANVIAVEEAPGRSEPEPPAADAPTVLHDLWRGFTGISRRTALEIYHDAVYNLSEAKSMFVLGQLALTEWARVEEIYAATCHRVRDIFRTNPGVFAEHLDELNEKLADKLFCNFSLFQSMPDAWAIDQIFPVLPLSRLDERPDHRGIVQDITCDSDGKIERYVDGEGIEPTLPMPKPDPARPMLIGIFMVGAYQEILGDMHNLFGDTHSVHVDLRPDGSYEFINPLQGDTVSDMLRYVDFDPDDLRDAYRRKLSASNLDAAAQAEIFAEFDAGLTGYSYLED